MYEAIASSDILKNVSKSPTTGKSGFRNGTYKKTKRKEKVVVCWIADSCRYNY